MYSPVVARSYVQNDCGEKYLQALIGVDIPLYGNNGRLFFTSPLTDHVIFSSVEESKIIHVRIFPNPAFGYVNVEWPSLEEAQVFIYSQLGQLIATSKIEPQSLSTIDIATLLPGYYLVKVITPTNQIFNAKLIKQ
jgi:hypothetical protein